MFDINEACRSQIIAGDETGFASRPQKDSKYVVAKGRDSARVAERALIQHTSVMHLCDADGDSLAPMVMFKGKRLDATAMPDAPPDTVFQYQSKGYFEAKHFIEILRHIVRNHRIPESCKLTKMASDVQGKIDDSSSHLKTLETPVCHRILIVDNAPCHHHPLATAYAEEHWIHIVYLPPNFTHILQVSDLAVFASMKKFWYRIANTCTMVYSENFKFKPRTFWTFLKKAWEEGTKPANVIRGFLMAGQWPINVDRPLATLLKSKTNEDGQSINPLNNPQLMLDTMNDTCRIRTRELRRVRTENGALRTRIAELESSPVTNSINIDVDLSNVAASIDVRIDDDDDINGWQGPSGAMAIHMGTFVSPSKAQAEFNDELAPQTPAKYITRTNLPSTYSFVSPLQAQVIHANQVKRLQPHKIVISSEQQNSNAPQQIERVGVAALANLSIDELNEKLAKLERLVELQTMLEKPKQSNKAKKFTAKSSRSRAQPFSSSSSSDSTSSDSESEPKPRRQQTNAHNRRSKPPKLVKRARSSSDIESNSEARRPKRPASRRKPSRPQSLSRLSPGDSSSSDQEPVVRSRQRGAALTSSTTSAASGLSLTQPVRRHKRARSATPPPSPRSASRTLHVSVKLTITPVSAVSASGPRSIRPKYQLAHSDNIGVIRLRRFHTSRRILGRFD